MIVNAQDTHYTITAISNSDNNLMLISCDIGSDGSVARVDDASWSSLVRMGGTCGEFGAINTVTTDQ